MRRLTSLTFEKNYYEFLGFLVRIKIFHIQNQAQCLTDQTCRRVFCLYLVFKRLID